MVASWPVQNFLGGALRVRWAAFNTHYFHHICRAPETIECWACGEELLEGCRAFFGCLWRADPGAERIEYHARVYHCVSCYTLSRQIEHWAREEARVLLDEDEWERDLPTDRVVMDCPLNRIEVPSTVLGGSVADLVVRFLFAGPMIEECKPSCWISGPYYNPRRALEYLRGKKGALDGVDVLGGSLVEFAHVIEAMSSV